MAFSLIIYKAYLGLEVSVDIFDMVSVDIFDMVSGVAIGADIVSVDIFELESLVVVSVVALSLQAAKAPIAKITKNFFMLNFFSVMNLYR